MNNNKINRIAILSHVNAQPLGQVRWKRFANMFKEIDLHLISPCIWNSNYLTEPVVFRQEDSFVENFNIHTVDVINNGNDSTYLFKGLFSKLRKIKPDLIYVIGINFAMIHAILLRMIFFRNTKLIVFTMGAPIQKPRFLRKHLRYPQNFIVEWLEWKLAINYTDSIICHYPQLEENIRNLGYKNKILVQTQIGVDEELYKLDQNLREKLRSDMRLDGFVIGFTGRINKIKGIFDLAKLMPELPVNVKFLLVGDGPDTNELIEIARNENWYDRLFLTGYVSPFEVAKYMSVMDCFFVGSRTTKNWVDTFPNVLAQAMTLGIPVIGSSSGAIPFMIGDQELIFEEGNLSEIKNLINKVMTEKDWTIEKTRLTKERALAEFSTQGINTNFYNFLKNNYSIV
jgi:glycosyltransferase involved in cell wall biosynthesis